MNNDKAPLYRRILDMLKGTVNNMSNVNERGQQMLDAERARNEQMMRENGIMDRDGTVATSTNPELFESPIPFAKPMGDFLERLMQARGRTN